MTPKTPKPSRLAYERYEQEEKLAGIYSGEYSLDI